MPQAVINGQVRSREPLDPALQPQVNGRSLTHLINTMSLF